MGEVDVGRDDQREAVEQCGGVLRQAPVHQSGLSFRNTCDPSLAIMAKPVMVSKPARAGGQADPRCAKTAESTGSNVSAARIGVSARGIRGQAT
jgi:hypothetical protein